MEHPTDGIDWPVKIAIKAVGLQATNEHNPTVNEINLDPKSGIWVLNHSTHITVDRSHIREVHLYGWAIFE